MSEAHAEQKSGVLSQGLLSVIAHGITSIATFFAVIGIVRGLGTEAWGQFSLAIQITVFSSMIADFGIGPVIMRRQVYHLHYDVPGLDFVDDSILDAQPGRSVAAPFTTQGLIVEPSDLPEPLWPG